jgi:hypothetical protein
LLKISKILLKSLLQLVDIKLLSLMWYWSDKNFKRIPSVCGTTSDVQQVTLCCFSFCGSQLQCITDWHTHTNNIRCMATQFKATS